MTESLNNAEIKNRAKELVEQHGSSAIKIAQRKVDVFPKDCYSREKDSSLMLLTEVEKLTNST
jgi:hypothetical protein